MFDQKIVNQIQIDFIHRNLKSIEGELILFSSKNNLSDYLGEHKILALQTIKELIVVSKHKNWSFYEATDNFHVYVNKTIKNNTTNILNIITENILNDWVFLLVYYNLCSLLPANKEMTEEEKAEKNNNLSKDLKEQIPTFITKKQYSKDHRDLPTNISLTLDPDAIVKAFRIIIAHSHNHTKPEKIAQMSIFLSEEQATKSVENRDEPMLREMTTSFQQIFSHQMDDKIMEICHEVVSFFLTHSPRQTESESRKVKQQLKESLNNFKTEKTSRLLDIKPGNTKDSGTTRDGLIRLIKTASRQLRDNSIDPTQTAVAEEIGFDESYYIKLLKKHYINKEDDKSLRYNS